ncbi:MAG TPA: MFS transporter [Actinomycetota bacterium]|nr:MFS transporter [Actinomycetota bacterium]
MKAERSRSLWRHPDFMKLWTAETISQLGTQVTLLALPLTAILILKATPFQVGLLGTLEFLPFILVGLPAGVWVDRLRRRPILIVGDLGRVLALGSIPVAYELGVLHIGQLYIVAFVTGVLTVFFDVSYQSYLPSLVERDQIVDGNAKLEVSRSGAQLAGPGLAGALIQILTAPVAILADAISYLGSACFVFLIRKKEPPVESHLPDGSRLKMRREIGEGLRYVWRHPLLRPIAFCTGTSNLFSNLAGAVILIFAVRRLGMSPGTIGLALGLGNVGFLLAAFLAPRVAKRLGIGPTIVGSAVLFGFAWFPAALMTREIAFPLLVLGMFIGGFGGTIYNINQVSLRQSITPDRMQGRMNATMRFMVWGTIPIGSFVGGILGGTIGLRPTLWVAAVGSLLAFIPPLFSPVRTLEQIPEMPTEEAGLAEALSASDEGAVELAAPPRPSPSRPGTS